MDRYVHANKVVSFEFSLNTAEIQSSLVIMTKLSLLSMFSSRVIQCYGYWFKNPKLSLLS